MFSACATDRHVIDNVDGSTRADRRTMAGPGANVGAAIGPPTQDHGPVYFEDDRRLMYNAAGMLSEDGGTFVSIGWVEVNDPARIDEVQALRNESSPPETARRVYEMRVIEIPIP